MHLVERREHLAQLGELAARSSGRQGQVALVSGPPATGRTSVLQAFVEQQLGEGALVLSASCVPNESTLPLGVVRQLLHGAPLPGRHPEEIKELLAQAARHAVGFSSDVAPEELLAVHHHLVLRLNEVAADRLLVVTVDDIEHADIPSLCFLIQLVRRSLTGRIMIVLTDEGQRSGVPSPFVTELHRQPHLHRIPLAPLSAEGVREFLALRVGTATGDRHAQRLHEETGGNPLLLDALVEDRFASRDGSGRYELAVLSYLHRGGPRMLEVARARALLDESAEWVAPGRLIDLAPKAEEQIAAQLRDAGVLDGTGAFRRASARAAVLDEIPAEHRAALHRRAAELLGDCGAPLPAMAGHLLEAGAPPPPWATPLLQEAAEQSLRAHDLQRAARYLELALEGATDPAVAAMTRARLAHAEWTMSPGSTGRHIPQLTAALRAGHLQRREGLNLVRHLLWHGRTDEAVELLDLLRSQAEQDSEAAAELRGLEQWLAITHPTLARRVGPPSGGPDGNVHLLSPLADPWLQSTAALSGLLSRGQSAKAVSRAKETLRDLHLGQHTCWVDEAALLSFSTLTAANQLDSVMEWCERLFEREKGGRTLPWRAVVLAVQSEVALRRGDLTGTVEACTAALEELNVRAWGVAAGLPLGNLLQAYARLGRFDEAAEVLAQPVPDAMFRTRYGLHYLYGRGQLYLMTRHYHVALADFLSCGDLVRGWGLDPVGIVPWAAGAAEAWLGLGNHDQTRQLVSDLLARTGDRGARNRALALRLMAAVSPAPRRPQLLLEVLELMESCGDRYEQARTLADLSDAYHRLDDNRRARMLHRRALHMARMCEAEPLVRELLSVSRELVEVLADSGGTDHLAALTDSERRVAALAAMGYTNREIAAKIYVTPSTVEQHLTRVYRKLNIKHRKQLPSDLSWHLEAAS
ncbi:MULTISPECIES: AAA family ATPase [unclassified Streptomyces]|uniref:helix-turn-helix transcriptional regulator n=1 Tax=unclassified Streptomyces TaxID=2593676 RepID=UPI00340D9C35